jgi:hypothetical protein
MKKIIIFLLLFLPFVTFGQSVSEVTKKVTTIDSIGVSKVKSIISNRVVPETLISDEELDPEYQEVNFKGEADNTKYELPSENAMTDHERYNYDLRKLSTAKKPK